MHNPQLATNLASVGILALHCQGDWMLYEPTSKEAEAAIRSGKGFEWIVGHMGDGAISYISPEPSPVMWTDFDAERLYGARAIIEAEQLLEP